MINKIFITITSNKQKLDKQFYSYIIILTTTPQSIPLISNSKSCNTPFQLFTKLTQDDADTAATLLLQTQSLNSFTSIEHRSDVLGFEE